jgi:regulation of enolase protein 1 (concanavalin A-like superfamily)
VPLQPHTLAYNLATFLRRIKLPEAMADWSLSSLQLKLIKIGMRVVRHARAIYIQLAEVAVTDPMVRAI